MTLPGFPQPTCLPLSDGDGDRANHVGDELPPN